MLKAVLTTGEVARLCNVSAPTVIKWIDTGLLEGYRIPGSKERRVQREALVSFMKEHRIPLDELEAALAEEDEEEHRRPRVLIADDNADFAQFVTDALGEYGDYELQVATSGFRAGVAVKAFKPDVLLLDIFLGDLDGRDVCKSIREDPELAKVKIVALSAQIDESELQTLREQGFDDCLHKPVPVSALTSKVDELLRGRGRKG